MARLPTFRLSIHAARAALFAAAMTVTLAACGDDDDAPPAGLTDAPPVIAQYAVIVHASYDDALTGATALRTALAALVATPSDATLEAARTAWIAARVAYRQTEVYRFYGGPIDAAADDVEIRLNSWPLDEVYIDYVADDADAGMINDLIGAPNLTALVLANANMAGGESNVSLGYHAIEFLLWGQDIAAEGPGTRPFTDYVVGEGGSAANQARRGEYLLVTADVLIEDLTAVRDAWAPGATSYAAELVAATPTDALARMLTGIGAMSASELSGERMLTAYENKDQEDEHSCFSDTTLDDIAGNLQGIENVYLGSYGTLSGAGIDDLVAARDAELDTKMKASLATAKAAVAAIPGPFDQAILGPDTADGRVKVLAAVRAVQDVGAVVVEIATALGIEINVDL